MSETMIRRLAMVLLPEMHHGISSATDSPEASAYKLAQKVLEAMREPTGSMVEAGEAAPRKVGANMADAETSYSAMIDAAWREGSGGS